MKDSLAFVDWTIIVGFFVVMLGVGLYFSTRMKDLQDYFSGGRQVPWWLSGISLYMSAFSAFSFVAYSALAYKYGWVAVTVNWLTIPAMLLSAVFFASRWRRAVSASPLEYIETRYGSALRQSLAWLGIPMTVIDDGLKLFAIGTLVSAGLALEGQEIAGIHLDPLQVAIVASGLIMLSYTFLGGLWAVLVTDFVQFVVMAVTILVLVPLALTRVGGLEGLIEGLPDGFFRLTHDPTDPEAKYTWGFLSFFLLIMTLNYCSKWSFVQRYYSVRTDSDARKVGYLVAFLSFVGPPLMFLPALAAKIFLPEIEDPNEVYILLSKSLLPVGMIGMMIAAMFSATMSMLSSDYNAVAAVLTNDVYKPLFSKNASDRSLVLAGRINTLLIGLISLGVGLLIAGQQGDNDLFQLMARLFGVFLPPIALPMLGGLIIQRVSHTGGLLGFLFGIISGLAAYFAAQVPGIGEAALFLRELPYVTSITVSTTLVGMVLGTLIAPNTAEQSDRIRSFLEGLDARTGAAEAERDDSAASPIPVIGAAIASLGVLVVVASVATGTFRQSLLTPGVGVVLTLIGVACWTLFSRGSKKQSN